MSSSIPNPTEFQILLALAGQDRHGYGIMQEVARQSGGSIRLGPGTLYGAIKRMLEAQWIAETQPKSTAAESESRRTSYYRLTPAGRRAAGEAAQQMADLVAVAAQYGLVAT